MRWSGDLLKASKLRRIPKGSMATRLRIIRMQNQLNKIKMENQMARMKMQQSNSIPLRRRFVLNAQPIIQRPRFFNPATSGDVDSAFSADIGHADGNIWGSESYYYENDFYNENFLGNEDFFGELVNFAGKRGSPLLW